MRKIVSIISDGSIEASEMLRLDHDMRNRRRMVFTTEQGSILLDMARPVHLRDGDILALDDGNACRIEAMAEAVIEIHAHDLPALVRIAWHLGNRHLPTQLLGDRLRIRHDHVIADMVLGLGGHCEPIMAPFDPERGAYAEDQVLPGAGHHHHHHHHEDEHHHG